MIQTKEKRHRDSAIEHSRALATRLTQTPSEECRQLVFVIGMPRSGTSLTDQILSSNTNVSSLGEVAHADDMAAQVKKLTGTLYPEGLSELSQQDIEKLGADFSGKNSLQACKLQSTNPQNPHELSAPRLTRRGLSKREALFIADATRRTTAFPFSSCHLLTTRTTRMSWKHWDSITGCMKA